MDGRHLLDTNIVIALFNREQPVIDSIAQSLEVFLPSIVIGELYYGAFNSSKQQANVEKIDRLRMQAFVLDCDAFTAKIYGQIKKSLKDAGNPIPENDIWIAALAIQYDLSLVTRDNHFSFIPGLQVERW